MDNRITGMPVVDGEGKLVSGYNDNAVMKYGCGGGSSQGLGGGEK